MKCQPHAGWHSLFTMPILTLVMLALALAYAALERAGVTPDWNWSLCAIGAACGLYYLATLRNPPPRPGRLPVWLLGGLTGLAALQTIPLPFGIVAILSPTRASLVRAAAPALGGIPAWTTLSLVPWKTLNYVLMLAAFGLVFLVVREIGITMEGGAHSWAVTWPLIAVAAAEGILGFAQVYGGNTDGFARGTYVNRDHYAGLLEIVLPFAALYPFAILFRERERHRSPAFPAIKACAVLACGCAILVGIVLSLSRMAFLATLASLVLAGVLAVGLRTSRMDVSVKSPLWKRWLPAALLTIVIVAGFVSLPSDPLISRFSEFANNEGISADARGQIWRESVSVVKAFPLLGCGFGGFESAFLPYKRVAPMYTVDFAHNDYLQVLAEGGIAGFAMGCLLLVLVLRSAIRGAIYARSLENRLLAIACIASLTAILLHSFVDFNMYVPGNALAVAWVAGIAAKRMSAGRKATARMRTSAASAGQRPTAASNLSNLE